jgi:hypothetical protein
MPKLSLDAIQRRIAQHDSELLALRRELEVRRSRLDSLGKRKQELQDQLRRIEAEMAAIAAGTQRPAARSSKTSTTKATPKLAPVSQSKPPSLANLIVAILRDVGRPLTVLELTQQAKQRGFPSKSKALHKLVGKTVYMSAAKGVLQRATDQSGYLVAPTGDGKAALKGAAKPSTKGAVPKPKIKASSKEAVKSGSAGKPAQRAAARSSRVGSTLSPRMALNWTEFV